MPYGVVPHKGKLGRRNKNTRLTAYKTPASWELTHAEWVECLVTVRVNPCSGWFTEHISTPMLATTHIVPPLPG